MREILFRGKRKDNSEWVKGFYVPSCYIENEKPKTHHYIIPMIFRLFDAKGNEKKALNFEECSYKIKVIPETVGQFTGLTDKNGKKIFEGDIVKCKDYLETKPFEFEFQGYVDFKNGSFVIVGDFMTHYRWLDYEVEVIGNIHDNPELLKEGEEE